jgi:hypothetical protein
MVLVQIRRKSAPPALQSLCRVDQQRRRLVPVPGVLQRLDLAEVERPYQAARRTQAAQAVPDDLVDDAVVGVPVDAVMGLHRGCSPDRLSSKVVA